MPADKLDQFADHILEEGGVKPPPAPAMVRHRTFLPGAGLAALFSGLGWFSVIAGGVVAAAAFLLDATLLPLGLAALGGGIYLVAISQVLTFLRAVALDTRDISDKAHGWPSSLEKTS